MLSRLAILLLIFFTFSESHALSYKLVRTENVQVRTDTGEISKESVQRMLLRVNEGIEKCWGSKFEVVVVTELPGTDSDSTGEASLATEAVAEKLKSMGIERRHIYQECISSAKAAERGITVPTRAKGIANVQIEFICTPGR